ncbi:hypothetical protein J0X15_08900 [Roseibium sp. CAU 1637]|uniref:Uncharacterized protein n=2 Tax=Roseibium TaxID=150830 RepID=A0A939J8H9_9HYPH|nr:hypothetical protein [Roseibium limicola]MBO0345336.1 hypothetical protein [Roseibium limicola]
MRLANLAATARFHWQAVGAPEGIAHANLLFAWAMAKAGAGDAALLAASDALAHFKDKPSEPSELAAAQAAMAAACLAAGLRDGYARHHAQASELAATIGADTVVPSLAAFKALPVPGAIPASIAVPPVITKQSDTD